jgi:hypothetical protein
MKRNKFREDMVVGIVLFIFSAIAFYLIYHNLHNNYREEYGLSPATFPLITMASIIIMSIGLLISSYLNLRLHKKEIESAERLNRSQVRQVAVIMTISVAYIYMINLLGFYISTIIVNILLMLVLKMKSWFRLAASSIILIACIYLFFEKGMKITLPRGWFF